jgi:hypothetical protein
MASLVFGSSTDPALLPVAINTNPGPHYADHTRFFQGIPGIARAPGGRLWAIWYAGGEGEGPENYVVGVTSADNGATWSAPVFVIDPPGDVRAFDPVPWVDPAGRLWIFYAQSYRWWDGRAGVWTVTAANPDAAQPAWSAPRRIADGIMMNKPTVLRDGSWLLPIAVWSHEPERDPAKPRFVPDAQRRWDPTRIGDHVYHSTDAGASFARLGTARFSNVRFAEHMIVERDDGALWLLARTQDGGSAGLAESVSTDAGRTWSPGRTAAIPHVRSRFFIRRLQSGALLLVKHNPPMDSVMQVPHIRSSWRERSHLTAYLSDDDGTTWSGGLLLDERVAVSYPDGDQAADGTIFIIYDRNRTSDREILLARFTEADVRAGRPVSQQAALGTVINKATAREKLYNGIILADPWPPRYMELTDRAVEPPEPLDPMPVPYLDNPPALLPIDVGRQLFVDDFLIESTTLRRVFHQAVKHAGNPILKPETEIENSRGLPVAAPKSGGVWWDPADGIFKMWYETGWLYSMAYATSRDGIAWERPDLGIVPGTNAIVPVLHPDSTTVFLDHDATDPAQRFKMFLREPNVPGISTMPGFVLVSADGIDWRLGRMTGELGDRSTMFYNPFRKKWVYSVRASGALRAYSGRARLYREHDDFLAGAAWEHADLVHWAGADKLDPPDPEIGDRAQLYNLDAVAYESLLLGVFQIHLGPHNNVCQRTGTPKITELMLAYSRDGFHWHRPDRAAFIPASRTADAWDRGYVQSVGGVCAIVGDELWFYYIGFRGDSANRNRVQLLNGMYAHGSTGIAKLRRDGFASMDADAAGGTLTTRPLLFSGRHLFVNAACADGELRVEVLDANGAPIAPYTLANCRAVGTHHTRAPVTWAGAADLAPLAGQPVRFRFHLRAGALYAFWVSPDSSGASHGYVAAGGPGFTGGTDTVGKR